MSFRPLNVPRKEQEQAEEQAKKRHRHGIGGPVPESLIRALGVAVESFPDGEMLTTETNTGEDHED